MLGLNKATLSRHASHGDIAFQPVGFGRGKAIPPEEVLRLGSIYRRVPLPDLRHNLASFVAERAHANVETVGHSLEELTVNEEAGGQGGTAAMRRGAGTARVPEWMLEFERLSTSSSAQGDAYTFVDGQEYEDHRYAGSYREDTGDLTLHDLGLDPAVLVAG